MPRRHLVYLAALLAGVLYCSWPLGLLLNPQLSRGVASAFEAPEQPYSWLFVLLDVLSGLLVCLLAAWLWRLPGLRGYLRLLVAGAYGLFGALTIAAALLPLHCNVHSVRCLAGLSNPSDQLHDVVSLVSMLALAAAAIALGVLLKGGRRLAAAERLGFILLSVGWLAAGCITLTILLRHGGVAWPQRVFIILSSLWTIALPFFVVRLSGARPDLPYQSS